MKVAGKIKRIEPLKEVGVNKLKIRDVIIVTDEQYSQTLAIQFKQNLAENFNFNVDQNVVIDINLKGREYTKPDGTVNVFNTIEGWKIESKT